jgi:hypothetical protein
MRRGVKVLRTSVERRVSATARCLFSKKDGKQHEDSDQDDDCNGRISVHKGRPATLPRRRTMTVELEDGEKETLAALLKQTIAVDPFPMSPRVRQLRSILEKRAQPCAAKEAGQALA